MASDCLTARRAVKAVRPLLRSPADLLFGVSDQNHDPDALPDCAVLLKIGPARQTSQALAHSNVQAAHPMGAPGQIADATSQKKDGTEQIGHARAQRRSATAQLNFAREHENVAGSHRWNETSHPIRA
jgi:hypothetical protein